MYFQKLEKLPTSVKYKMIKFRVEKWEIENKLDHDVNSKSARRGPCTPLFEPMFIGMYFNKFFFFQQKIIVFISIK